MDISLIADRFSHSRVETDWQDQVQHPCVKPEVKFLSDLYGNGHLHLVDDTLIFIYLFIYLVAPGLSYHTQTLSCGMWDLVP